MKDKITAFLQLPTHENIIKSCEDFCNVCKEGSMILLGNTLLGKNIPGLSVGRGEKIYIYIAGHHASEWITSCVLMKFAKELSHQLRGEKIFGYDKEYYLHTRKIIIIPALNIDGIDLALNGIDKNNILYERLCAMNQGEDFSRWKANARGVDLNHNYNAGFDKYKKIEAELGKISGCDSGYSGEYPESEPETSALCNLIRITEPRSLITLHSQGEEIYCSSCGKTDERHEKYAMQLAKLSGYVFSKPEGKASYGGLTDWFIQEYQRPAFTIECGKGTNPLPLKDATKIYFHLREMFFRFPFIL
jgi:g-D-glutamyl-meso-diaminopimelate peptidase